MERVIEQIAKAPIIIFRLICLVVLVVLFVVLEEFGAHLSYLIACLLPIAWLLGLHRLVHSYGRKDTQHTKPFSAWVGKHPGIATVIFFSVPIVILSLLFNAFDALILGITLNIVIVALGSSAGHEHKEAERRQQEETRRRQHEQERRQREEAERKQKAWRRRQQTKAEAERRRRQQERAQQYYDESVDRRHDDDYYRMLQVDPLAEPEVIEAAYRRLAAKYHPDISKSPDATQRMQMLNEAYEVLRDPIKREQYNRTRVINQNKRNVMDA